VRQDQRHREEQQRSGAGTAAGPGADPDRRPARSRFVSGPAQVQRRQQHEPQGHRAGR